MTSSKRNPSPVLSMDGVRLQRDRQRVLQDVQWTVHEGQRWVVLGENGSGKTSLLQLASTYERPSRGRIQVLGQTIGKVDVRDLRGRIGYSAAPLQRRLDPRINALTAVATGKHAMLTHWRETYAAADWDLAAKLLHEVGLGGFEDRRIATLSEGETQRLHLARSLMGRPELLLLDEVAAGLDIGAREQLVQMLEDLDSLNHVRGVVLVTHHLEEVPSSFTHALLLRGGRVIASGQIKTVLTSAALSECFGVPLTVIRHHGRFSARAA